MNDTNEKIIKELTLGKLSIRAISRMLNVNVDRVRYYHYKLNKPDKFQSRFIDKTNRYRQSEKYKKRVRKPKKTK